MFWYILELGFFLGLTVFCIIHYVKSKRFDELSDNAVEYDDARVYLDKSIAELETCRKATVCVFIVLVILLCLGGLVTKIISPSPSNSVELESTDLGATPIYSLQNSDSIKGSFVLGTGSVEGLDCYAYYVQTDQGLVRKTVEADHAYIQMTNEKEPCVSQREVVYGKDLSAAKKFFVFGGYDTDTEIETVFYVPEGTVLQKYDLNS